MTPVSTRRRPAPGRPFAAVSFLPAAWLATLCVSASAHGPGGADVDADAPAADLPAVKVVGRIESGAYHAGDAAGAKTALPLRELPQSVRVITRQALDDLGATRLDDVLDYVGGVSRQNSFGGLWDNLAIRGLPGNENTGMATLLNGLSSNRGFNAPRDLAALERVEFLKGPAAALYGSSEPGGTLNLVSKRPRWRPAQSLEAYAGSQGLRRLAYDGTGALGEQVAVRLNLAAEDRDGFRDHVGTRRRVFAPAVTWRLGADTTLDYHGEWLRHATPLDRGVVAVDDRLGAIPRGRFLGEPADGDIRVDNQAHQLVLGHAWSDDWRSRLALSLRRTAIDGWSTEASALRADGLLTRQRRFRDYRSDDLALQAELQGRVVLGGREHELLAGVEAYRFEMDTLALRANPTAAAPYAIDVFQPVYGQPRPAPGPNVSTLDHQRNRALYLQDAVHLASDWRLLAGLRLDRYDQRLDNRLTATTTRQSPTATSPRLGLSWLPDARWTVYANLGRSFRPNVGIDAAGYAFEPESARALERGAKWERSDRRLGATVAAFDIRKRNVLTADPVNAGRQVAAGLLSSRGIEADLAGQLTTNWRLNASVVFNQVRVERDRTLEVGGRLLNVPRVNGSVLAVYESALADGRRYGIGGGFTHVGARLGQAQTQADVAAGTPAFELPAYTTAKLVAYWRITPSLRASLDVDNVFDLTFYTSSYSRVWVSPGAPRSVTVGLQAGF